MLRNELQGLQLAADSVRNGTARPVDALQAMEETPDLAHLLNELTTAGNIAVLVWACLACACHHIPVRIVHAAAVRFLSRQRLLSGSCGLCNAGALEAEAVSSFAGTW